MSTPSKKLSDVTAEIETLLLDLDVTKSQISAGEVKVQDAKEMLTDLEHVKTTYIPLVASLSGLGHPASKEERLAILTRMSQIRSSLCRLIPAPTSMAQTSTAGPVHQLQAQLLHIHLPVFNGDLEEWIEWSRAFQATVDSRVDLSPDAKMQYLLNSLTGEALHSIVDFDPTEGITRKPCGNCEAATKISLSF